MSTPMTQYDALIRELAREGARAARDAGYLPGSFAFGSFLRKYWTAAIAANHPHLLTFRIAFLEAAGVR